MSGRHGNERLNVDFNVHSNVHPDVHPAGHLNGCASVRPGTRKAAVFTVSSARNYGTRASPHPHFFPGGIE
jgi:hypothetical protein